jgi:Tol biopolymer transport system component
MVSSVRSTCALVTIAFAPTLVQPTDVSQRPPEIIRHVWTGPPPADLDDTWAVSPAGEVLAYRDEQSQLAVYEFRTGQKRLLSDRLPSDQSRTRIVWSADGKQLAYNRNATGDQVEVRIAAVDDQPVRVVMRRGSYVAPLAWSPNSERVLILSEQGSIDEIAWVSLATGEMQSVKRLEATQRNEWQPRAILSTDGQRLAFSKIAADGRNRDVFVSRMDGTLEAAVVEHPADDYPLAWTPDGNQLLFASDRTGSTDLWAVSMVDGTPKGIARRVRRDLGRIRPLGLTRDGALYYAVNLSLTDVFTVALDPTSGRVVSTPKPVASRFVGNNSGPDLSPEGEEIVYQVGLPGTGIDLVVQSLEGNQQRMVHPKLHQFSRPRFDPRGRTVVVHGTSGDGTQGIFRVDLTTGEVTLMVSNPPADLANPGWSRDGRTLFFERDDRAVWMLDRESNQTNLVYAFPASASNFTSAPSPDGRQVASVHGASLYVIDVRTREAKEILRVDKPERLHDFPGSLAWMPDGRTIIFGKTIGDKRELWRISKDGTGLQPAGLEVERQNLYFLRVSQDGTRMAFVMGDYDIRPLEVWVMENFLR